MPYVQLVKLSLSDQIAQFFNTKTIVYRKNKLQAPGHALGSRFTQSLRVDFIKVGTANARDVIALRPWKTTQRHGWGSTSLTGTWVPYTQQQVVEGPVGNVNFLFTADLNGCTATATWQAGTLRIAHIAADYNGADREDRIAAADFVWGPDQYDPLMAGAAGFETHFFMASRGTGDGFYAQGKTSGMDAYQPLVRYSPALRKVSDQRRGAIKSRAMPVRPALLCARARNSRVIRRASIKVE